MIKKYLPSIPQVTSEALAVLLASVGVALLVYYCPPLKKFINENSVGGYAPSESMRA